TVVVLHEKFHQWMKVARAGLLNERLNGVLGINLHNIGDFVQMVLHFTRWTRVDADAAPGENVQLVEHVENLGGGLVDGGDDGQRVRLCQFVQRGDYLEKGAIFKQGMSAMGAVYLRFPPNLCPARWLAHRCKSGWA